MELSKQELRDRSDLYRAYEDALTELECRRSEAATLATKVAQNREAAKRAAKRVEVLGELLAEQGVSGATVVSISNVRPAQLLTLSRTAAVVAVLDEAGPLHRKAIAQKLVEAGRSDAVSDVSAALAQLRRTGRVQQVERGVWRAAGDSHAG